MNIFEKLLIAMVSLYMGYVFILALANTICDCI
jgi:hypothetical protein